MITTAGVFSVKGLNHHLYEDRYRVLGGEVPLVHAANRGHLFAVMDGVGSAPKGMRAAQHVADKLTDFYKHAGVPATSQGLYELLVRTSHEIHAWGMIDGTDRPLGAAAATVAWFAPAQKLVIFHCGDTMAWRFDGTRVERLTREHVIGRGITHYFGQTDQFRLDVESFSFEPGDLLCMVTDGVTKSMVDSDVQRVLQECSVPEDAARELVHRARGKGSRDDITALIVELEEW